METIKTMSDLGVSDQLILIFVGFMAALMIMREVVYWIDRFRRRKGEKHIECGQLAIEVQRTNANLQKLIDTINTHSAEDIKAREQIDDVFHWLAPNSDGEQIWKNAALNRNVNRMLDMINSIITDLNTIKRA